MVSFQMTLERLSEIFNDTHAASCGHSASAELLVQVISEETTNKN